MTLFWADFCPEIFYFRDHISNFGAILIRPKISPNNLGTSPKKLSKNPENGFVDPANGQNEPLRRLNFDQKFRF